MLERKEEHLPKEKKKKTKEKKKVGGRATKIKKIGGLHL